MEIKPTDPQSTEGPGDPFVDPLPVSVEAQQRRAEAEAANVSSMELRGRYVANGPVIGDEVMLVESVSAGVVSAVHSDGSVDVTVGSHAVSVSVQHISRMKDPKTHLGTKGWYHRLFDFSDTPKTAFIADSTRLENE